jgi:hypothetical protein
MRAVFLALCAACMYLTLSTAAGASSAGAQSPEPNEARADRWQGRHHYLFDEQNRPNGPATTGAASPETSGCATTTVRMRRSDGSTVLRRIRRCD